MAILASSGLAIFAWVNQNLETASRLREHELRARLLSSAQALVETVNPMQRPAGEMTVADITVAWTSELIEPVRRNLGFGAEGQGAWQVGLYKLDVRARDARQQVDIRYEQWRTGTQRLVPVAPDIDR